MKVRVVLFAASVLLMSSGLSAQPLVGYWIGLLPPSNPKDSARRFVLQADGKTKPNVVLYSIDQDREPWTPDSIDIAGDHIRLRMDQGRAAFGGSISPDSRTIAGNWDETGFTSRPLVFKKAIKKADWQLIQPNAKDVQIVAEAKSILHSPEMWDRHDSDQHKCESHATSFTVYCAFEVATKNISGNFGHRDTALEEARFVIESRGKHYAHRLLGYNNDPEITFNMLQKFFDQVERRVKSDIEDAQAADAAR